MKLQRFLFTLLAVLISVTACYRDEIASMQKQIDTFTQVHINPILEQVKQIDAAVEVLKKRDAELASDIQKLQAMKGELEGKISDLDTRIADAIKKADGNRAAIEALEATRDEMKNRLNSIDAAIEDLEKRIGSLENQIKELETFKEQLSALDGRIDDVNGRVDWVQANYLSLEKFRETVDSLAPVLEDLREIKATLGNVIDYIPAIERRFDRDEADIEALQKEIEQIRTDYAEAIEKARLDVLDILDKKVENLQNWVISSIKDTLDDYYTIAATDQLLANLKATIEKGYKDGDADIEKGYKDGDAELLKKIEGLSGDLDKAKKEIEDAYKKAIQDVADEFDKKYKEQGGKIENIEKKLTSIEASISDLDDIRTGLMSVEKLAQDTKIALETITGRVNDLEKQVELIEADIEKLKGIDKKVNERIDSLGKAHKDSTKNLRDEIGRLKQADATINKAIDDLQTYIDGELVDGIKGWANQTFATLERENALADSLVAVFNLLGMSPDGMGGWVSSKFDNYYDIATVDAKLAEIGSGAAADIDSVKQNLRSEIANLKTTLTTDYETYIANAIAQGGIINKAISDSVSTLRSEVNVKLAGIDKEIADIKARLTALENVVQSVVFVPEYDDGKIFIPSEYNESTKKYSNPKKDIVLSYKINTKNSGFDPKNYDITGDLIDAKSATKVVYAGQKIDFDKIEYNKEKSLLAVTFNSKVIPDWFFDETKSAAMSLTISDDNTELSSSYIGLRLEKVAGGGGGGGEDPVGNFRVDPAAISVGNQGGITTAMVLAVSDLTWRIKSKPNWVDVQVIGYSLLSDYNGTQFISVAISKNTSDEARDGEVVFSEVVVFGTPETATLKIHQEKREPQTIDISPSLPSEVHFDWEGYTAESTRSYVYRVTPSDQMSDWTVSYNNSASWLHVTQSESLGAGARDVTITVDRRTKSVKGYYTEGHEADVVFSSVSGDIHTVHVVQDFRPKGELMFTPSQMSCEFEWDDVNNTKYEYTLQPTDSLADWKYRTIDPFDDYFDGRGYGSPDKTTGKGTLNIYTRSRNTSFKDRSGQIIFTTADGQTSYTFTAIQKARPSQTVELSPNTNPVEFDWEGKRDGNTSYNVDVITSDNITDWEYSKDADWFSVRTINNKASLQVYNVGSFEKSEDEYREGHITVRPAGPNDEYKEANKIVLTVKQYRRPTQTLTLGIEKGTTLEFRWDAATPKVEPKQAQTFEISVSSSDGRGDWEYYLPGERKPKQDDYFTVSKTTRENVDYVVVNVNANNNKSDVEPGTTLTIESATGQTYEFPLKQNARPEQTLEFNPASGSSFSFGWKGGTDKLTVTSSDKLDDWKVNGKPTWLTFEKGQNSEGVVEVSIAVGEYNQGRECTIEIVNGNGNKVGEFTVAQDARSAQTFSPSPASGTQFEFHKNGKLRETGESSVTVNLNPSDTEYDYGVEKSSNSSWCTVSNPKDGTLKFSVNDLGNIGSRSCTVTIKSATESQTVTYTIIQKKTYIESTIPTEETEINSGTQYSYTIKAYGEGCKIYYTKDVDYGTIDVSSIGSNKSSATDISGDVSVKIKATKNNRSRLTGTVTFHILDSTGNEIDSMQVDYSYDYGLLAGYHYYVQAQN